MVDVPRSTESFLADPDAVLAPFAEALRQAPNAREVAWLLAETAGSTLGLDDVIVYLLQEDGDTLLQSAAWGGKQVARRIIEHPIRLLLGEGIVGAAALTRMPLMVADSRLYPHYVVDDETRLSEIALPIMLDGRLFGVLDSEHPDADHFCSTHLRAGSVLVALAAQRLAALRRSD